jgi:hypothetical protein
MIQPGECRKQDHQEKALDADLRRDDDSEQHRGRKLTAAEGVWQ